MFKIDIENTNDLNGSIPPLKEEQKDNEVVAEQPKEADSDEVESQDEAGKDLVEVKSKEEQKPIKQDRYWSKLKKEREEKAQLAEQLEQLHHEKMQMEHMLRQAINTGSAHYKHNVASELEMAQAKLQVALESGDAAGVSIATAEISKATHALNEASKLPPLPEPRYSNDYHNQVKAQEYEDRLYSWLESNPEVDRNTPEYDEKVASQVLSFIQRLDRKYQSSGKNHLIGSSGYYSMIDDYMDNLKAQDTASSNMSAKHFGAVRSRSPMESIPDSRVRELSEREKKAALSFGMSYERYRELLDKHNKEMRSKNGS
jgi:hypothetical protein